MTLSSNNLWASTSFYSWKSHNSQEPQYVGCNTVPEGRLSLCVCEKRVLLTILSSIPNQSESLVLSSIYLKPTNHHRTIFLQTTKSCVKNKTWRFVTGFLWQSLFLSHPKKHLFPNFRSHVHIYSRSVPEHVFFTVNRKWFCYGLVQILNIFTHKNKNIFCHKRCFVPQKHVLWKHV